MPKILHKQSERILGISIGQVINEIGGGVTGGNKIKLLQTGGPLGGVLGEAGLEINIDFDEGPDGYESFDMLQSNRQIFLKFQYLFQT